MATCRSVIETALRKLGRLGAGRSARDVDAADALSVLSSLYQGWIASGAFGRLETIVPIATDITVSGNQRVIVADDAVTVTLPQLVSTDTIADYGRERVGYFGTLVTITYLNGGHTVVVDVKPGQIIGNATTPRDGWVVVVTSRESGLTRTWIYDGMVSAWQSIDGLTLDSQAPRSVNSDGLAATLAMALADQYGLDPAGTTQRAAMVYQQQLTSRYSMRREEVAGSYF